MRFATAAMALIAAAASASAAAVHFQTLDDKVRTIYFTPSPGSAQMEPVKVSGPETKIVPFAENWQGMYYAVQEGKENKGFGMLGEVKFGGWMGKTYFDVSAIDMPDDHDNIMEMWPVSTKEPKSGCNVWPCNNAYYLPDDVQTKVTDEVEILQTLGKGHA